jgi:hypothetical protein
MIPRLGSAGRRGRARSVAVVLLAIEAGCGIRSAEHRNQDREGANMSDKLTLGQAEQDRISKAARDYLLHKGWKPDEFRVELKALGDGEATVIVWGVFLEDEKHPFRGPPRSLELHVDRASGRVVKELAFQ